jgi:STE24 endopeptidase
MGLFAAHGYTAKEIYVMNASKRTTRANAFCTGLGKGKKIALFDNLVDNYTEDEITAVFAHELGHAKHRDTLKLVGLQAIIYAAMSLLITFMLTSETVSLALGFDTYNAAGAFIALSAVVLGPVMTILMAPINILSRRFERAADTFAVDNGLGDPLVDALTRLHRDSLADLNPHPFLSAIGDSHPTLGERIQVVRSAQERRGERGSKSDAS